MKLYGDKFKKLKQFKYLGSTFGEDEKNMELGHMFSEKARMMVGLRCL